MNIFKLLKKEQCKNYTFNYSSYYNICIIRTEIIYKTKNILYTTYKDAFYTCNYINTCVIICRL